MADSADTQDRIGKYIALGVLGRGEMGIVVRAFDPELERNVAIKLLAPRSLGADEQLARGRLLAEARALARVSHPNVVAVHEVGVHGDRVYIAMELVKGVDVQEWLTTRRRSWREIVAVFEAAGRGLQAVHAAGLVHRDIKPSNMLVGDDGRVRIGDFGIARTNAAVSEPPPAEDDAPPVARDAASLTKDGMTVGTPVYMAPEQHRGADVGPAADQYAFCVALHESLYGRRPFAGDGPGLLAAKANPPPEPTGHDVPRWLFAIVVRGLQPDPSARFPGMDRLVAALHRDPSTRRRRVVGAAFGLAAAAAIVAAVVMREGPCEAGPDLVQSAWNDESRSTVRRAFESSPRSYAHPTGTRVLEALDAYAADWVAMHREACEATRVTGDQSDAMLDRRMTCLRASLRELDASVQMLGSGDEDVIDHAIGMTQQLPALSTCADTDALASAVAPPVDTATRQQVDEIRATLAEARVLERAGRYADALARAREATRASDATQYEAVVAEALAVRGKAEEALALVTEAKTTLAQAAWTGLAVGHDDIACEAAGALVWLSGERERDLDRALEWGELGRATLRRAGNQARAALQLHNGLGAAYANAGRYDDAVKHYDIAIERAAELPDGTLELAFARLNLANVWLATGERARALAGYEEQGAVVQGLLGEDHPRAVQIRGILASLLDEMGEHARAEQILREVVASLRRSVGPNSQEVGSALVRLGSSLHRLGRTDDSIAVTREALAVYEHLDDVEGIASCLENLGSTYERLGVHDAAEQTFTRALELIGRRLGEDHPSMVLALIGMGRIHATRLQWDESLAAFARADAIVRSRIGSDVRLVALTLEGRISQLTAEQRPSEALAVVREQLAIFAAAPDVLPSDIPLSRAQEAELLLDLARETEALEIAAATLPLARDELHDTELVARLERIETRARLALRDPAP